MKNLFRISMLTLTAALFAAGCGKDNIIKDDPNGPQTNQEVGYLVLSEMGVGVSPDVEIRQDENGATPSNVASWSKEATRATTEDADVKYKVDITEKATGSSVWSGTYADIKALTSPMELQPGRYVITAQSPDPIQTLAWDKPEYAGSSEFTIVRKLTTTVSDLVCTMSNIKTTVELSADLKKLFRLDGSDPLQTVVSLDKTECLFTHEESRAAFFKAVQSNNSLTVVLTGEYNWKGEGETPEYQHVEMTETIPNVKAGQWRKVNISVAHADDGNVKFLVTIETWVYDNLIDVDVMSPAFSFNKGEDVIPDVDKETSDLDSPTLQLDGGHDITKPFMITSSIFDMDLGTCSDRISVIATPNGDAKIADAYCIFESDNAAFLAAVASAGYTDHKVALYPTNSASKYAVIRTDAANRLLVKVNDAGMFGLYEFAGTHTAKIVVTDNQNRRSFTKMTISVVKGESGAGPTVVWRGADIDKRYDVTSEMSVVIDITSESGITAFTVDIEGELLLSDDLTMLGLATHMDLVNPATPEMRSALESFGFLPKDGSSISGLKSMTFDISTLIPLLPGLGRKGTADFKLTATDAAGNTVKSLKFQVL